MEFLNNMVLQREYFKTLPGILKILELFLSSLGMLMTVIFNNYSKLYFTISRIYAWVSGFAVFLILVIGLLHFLGLAETLKPILKHEKYFYSILMFFVLPYSSIMAYNGSPHIELILAGISGVLLSLTLLVDGINGFHSDTR